LDPKKKIGSFITPCRLQALQNAAQKADLTGSPQAGSLVLGLTFILMFSVNFLRKYTVFRTKYKFFADCVDKLLCIVKKRKRTLFDMNIEINVFF
jgi:hypothetical protein